MPAVATPHITDIDITLQVNGKEHHLKIEPRVTLLDALREYIGLTGTKKGCAEGTCGACTVLVDGKRIDSCLTLAVMHVGKEITTIEGLANGSQLHPIQTAFIKNDGFQCGYCTPGQICSAIAMLEEVAAGEPSLLTQNISDDRATQPDAATRQVVIETGATFLAGGKNLLDLMQRDIEQPDHLTDINALR
jgi:xanthine dehydrogenase YagT iron-sulfur-binding subunit